MEQGMPADEVGLGLEDQAALGLDGFQIGQALKPSIGEGFIGQRPEMLRWLQLRGVGRQEEEMDALRDASLLAGMPAGAIEDQCDPLGRSGTDVPGKGGEHLPEERRRHGGEQPPLGRTRRGPDEATDVEPLVALLHGRTRPRADGCPDPADQGQEANPMLVGGPELDLSSRMGDMDRLYLVAELS